MSTKPQTSSNRVPVNLVVRVTRNGNFILKKSQQPEEKNNNANTDKPKTPAN